MGKVDREGLPHPIPADRLQEMLQADPHFCSWDPAYSTARDGLSGWPYLFSQPLMSASKPAH